MQLRYIYKNVSIVRSTFELETFAIVQMIVMGYGGIIIFISVYITRYTQQICTTHLKCPR